ASREPQAPPTPQGHARHEKSNQDGQLVVNVAVNRLKTQEKQHFQAHHSQASERRTKAGAPANASSGSRPAGDDRSNDDQQNSSPFHQPSKSNSRNRFEDVL